MILTKENIRSVDIDALINEKISSGRIEELLLIVPTNRKARNLKKEIISLMPGNSAASINIETVGTISSKLLKENKQFINLSEAASVVFIKQSAAEINPRYFSIYKTEIPFGTLDRIKNVISEYKRHGISPETLRKEAEKLEKSERLKALDIADIYENYSLKCNSLNAFELGDVYNQLNNLTIEQFNVGFNKLFYNVRLVVVNGFDEFAGPELEILNCIAGLSSLKLYINFDYSSANKYIFSHLDETYKQFERLGFKKITDKSSGELNRFQNIIRDNLFQYKKPNSKYRYEDKIIKLFAFDREKEVELIAYEIKELIDEQNVEPHKICVAFNLIQNYSPIVRDVFRKNGLPFNLTDRITLDNSNPVTAVVNLLEIAENDFYFKNIFRALSSGFIDTGEIDHSNLLKVSSALKIISGKENWINTLNDEINHLKYKSDEDDEETKTKENAYKKALKDIGTIAEKLKPFEEKLTLPEFSERFFNFIFQLKVPFKLLNTGNNTSAFGIEENIRGFTEFIETITEVFQLLEKEYGKETKFGLSFFMDHIRTVCKWARFNVKEKSDYGVQITNLEEIRGLQYDYLFLGGMCDGDLPTRYSPEIFYSGSFKKLVSIHQAEERNLFYQALCCWNNKLYFSFPQTESGRETVVSTFLNDFEELFEISVKNETDYSNTIYSNEQLHILAGGNGMDKIPGEIINNIDFKGIAKSIEVDKLRENDPFANSQFNGNIAGGESYVTENLTSFANKQYSISQLETYAKCPFKFFVERVLNIEKIEEPTEDIEAVEMGRLLHSILFEFYTKVRKEKIEISNCDDKTFSRIKEIIFEIADKEIVKTAFKSPLTFYEKEKIFGIDGNKDESIINRFIEYERKQENDFVPEYFEVSFGKLRKDTSDEILSDPDPIQIDGVKLRGKIDRLEISESGKSFNVVDYKLSGAKPTFRELKEGISLQLPVYLYAAGVLLGKKFGKNYSPNEMIIYSLKYALEEFGKSTVSIKHARDKEITTIEQLINRTIEHIKNYVYQISRGKFGLSPHENREQLVCRYCQFKSVCRIEGWKG